MGALTWPARRARQLRLEGFTFRAIAADLGCCHQTVRLVFLRPSNDPVGKRECDWSGGPSRLTLGDREDISRGLP
jgi:hypothetical protein